MGNKSLTSEVDDLKSKQVMVKLAIVVTFLITLIEGVLFIGSYQSEYNQLIELRNDLREDVFKKSGKDFHDLHPDILSDADIENRLKEFSRNVSLLVLVIIIFVVTGMMMSFYWLVGRHIIKLYKLNKSGQGKLFPEQEIPNNDFGAVIRSRNQMLIELEQYQHGLEDKLKEAEQSLIHAAKLTAVGESTSSIAHDLKNPLAVINGNISLLQKMINDEKTLKKLDKIEVASTKINQLVERLNRFGRKEFNLDQKVILQEIVENSLVLVESKINKTNTDLKVEIQDDLPDIKGDAGALEQVLMNLVSNAIDAMEDVEVKIITIKALKANENVKISISDSGVGIPVEKQETVFNAFYTSKDAGKGTGLGLSISKKIIENHHGSIYLNNKFQGGAEFIIELPILRENNKSESYDSDLFNGQVLSPKT